MDSSQLFFILKENLNLFGGLSVKNGYWRHSGLVEQPMVEDQEIPLNYLSTYQILQVLPTNWLFSVESSMSVI